MGKITGFIEFERVDEKNKAVKDRVKNYKEFTVPLSEKELKKQGSRCMDWVYLFAIADVRWAI